MSRIESIERYLRTQLAADASVPVRASDGATNAFITISRQTGIGGHALADAIVETFNRQPESGFFSGWQVFDRTVCEMVAEDPAYAKNLESLLEEEYRSTTADLFHQVLHRTADQDLVAQRVFLVVRTLAGMGKAIIVGRGGAQATEGMPGRLAFRVVAHFDHRVARAMDVHGLSERDARAGAARRDRDRKRLLQSSFGADIDDTDHYDLVVNSSRMSFEEIAEALAGVLRVRHRAS